MSAARSTVCLYVSPHLDDVALSCAGHVLEDVERGDRVVIATVFSDGDGYAARRREDDRAMAILGAEPIHLGLRDAPYRYGLAPSFRVLLIERQPRETEDEDAVAGRIAELACSLRAQQVLLPLGVGGHVDHRLTFLAHRRLAGDVRFYEDRPYATVTHAVRLRLAEIRAVILGEDPGDLRLEANASTVFATSLLEHMGRLLPAGDDRRHCLLELDQRLRAPWHRDGVRLAPMVRSWGEPVLDTATRAIGCYASQLPALFGEVEVAAALRADAGRLHAQCLAERVWHRVESIPDERRARA